MKLFGFFKKKDFPDGFQKEWYEYKCCCRYAGCAGKLNTSVSIQNPHCPLCGASMDLVKKTVSLKQ